MGTDDIFKKKKAARKKRSYEQLTPKANSFLIVTEGERTEPQYFRGLKEQIEKKVGGTVDIYEVPIIEITGEGLGTSSLIERTEKIVNKAKVIYQNIWVVFDKDDFDDFDAAIQEGERRGYKIGWSNQSFEYWLFLHFAYSDAALHRDNWEEKLSEQFKTYNLGDGEYHKNDENIYSLVDQFDGVNTAIKNAKRRMSNFNSISTKPSEFDPGTTVYILVEKLKSFLSEI